MRVAQFRAYQANVMAILPIDLPLSILRWASLNVSALNPLNVWVSVLLILPNIAKKQELIDEANRIRADIESSILVEGETITVSIGAGLYKSGDCRTDLLKRVDIALYKSKTDGRNRVTFSE